MMIHPPIEDVLEQTGGRFDLVVVAARRARQINAYFNQLGEGIGHYVPPQVHSLSHKPNTPTSCRNWNTTATRCSPSKQSLHNR